LHFDLADQYKTRFSLIHRLDPRVKVLVSLATIACLGFTPAGAWLAFVVFLLMITAVGVIAQLGATYALRRSYVALPFVMAAMGVPFTVHGQAVLSLPVLGWTLSDAGLVAFASILLRTWLAVQAAVLLTATTRFPDMLWALGALRLPQALIGTIGFMYRYLFVLADESLRMRRARSARSGAWRGPRKPSIGWQGRVAGNMVGSLFLRALERSERVYSAMLARGYDGRARMLARFRMRRLDWLALASGGVLLAGGLLIAFGV
jgi:cobalt/nickel transport system permease protein